jgi:CRISPR-associated protein Cas1
MNSDANAEPLLRVMSLRALLYCERRFYLEEVESLQAANEPVFDGRRLHTELERLEDGESWERLELADEALGVRGKLDAVRRRDGALIPYEHKRGRSQSTSAGPVPWPADQVQAAAYGLLLESATGEAVPEVRVRYHADGALCRIPLQEPVREMVRAAISRAQELRKQSQRPPVTENERLCVSCSLAPLCLPEEERFAQGGAVPQRLFAPAHEGQTLHITEPGTRVGRAGEMLRIEPREGAPSLIPSAQVEEIALYGGAQISSQALAFCASQEIGVHWFSLGGFYLGSFSRGAGQVQRRLRQYEALRDPSLCEALARRLVEAKVEAQLRFLLRASRGETRSEALELSLQAMRQSLAALETARGLDRLRGHEGDAARHYFSALPGLFVEGLEPVWIPDGRTRRPPRDRFNAALSFGYSLLYREVLGALLRCGLEPAVGFFHQPRSAAYPLALDVVELFRVSRWDMPLIASWNRRQWESADFLEAPGHVWLSESGRKKAIRLYEQRRQETWKHPVLGYSLSYGRHVELEARLLEKEWSGAPGLFARVRLR